MVAFRCPIGGCRRAEPTRRHLFPFGAGISAARSSSAPELAFASLALESPAAGDAPGLVGSDTDEFFFGAEAAETVNLAGGNDRLYGRGGDDILVGGSGNDWLDGGIGADTLTGGTRQRHLRRRRPR